MDNNHSSFARNLAQKRISLRISRGKLAIKAGISLSMLSKIERDETTPTILIASKLARSLNTTVSNLLGETLNEQYNVGNIPKFIESLRRADDNLEKIIVYRKELEPEFRANYDHTYIYDKDYRFLFVSILGAQTVGLSQSEMIGKHGRELGLPLEFIESVEANIRAVFTSGKQLTAEIAFAGPNRFNYFEYRLKPLFNERSCIEAVMATVKTITDRKLAELELKNHIIPLSNIIDACPLGVVTVDRYETINIFNKAAMNFLAPYLYDTWVGKSFQSLTTRIGIDYKQTLLVRSLQGEEIKSVQIHALGKLWLASASPLRDSIGLICGGLLYFQPVTSNNCNEYNQ